MISRTQYYRNLSLPEAKYVTIAEGIEKGLLFEGGEVIHVAKGNKGGNGTYGIKPWRKMSNRKQYQRIR